MPRTAKTPESPGSRDGSSGAEAFGAFVQDQIVRRYQFRVLDKTSRLHIAADHKRKNDTLQKAEEILYCFLKGWIPLGTPGVAEVKAELMRITRQGLGSDQERRWVNALHKRWNILALYWKTR